MSVKLLLISHLIWPEWKQENINVVAMARVVDNLKTPWRKNKLFFLVAIITNLYPCL